MTDHKKCEHKLSYELQDSFFKYWCPCCGAIYEKIGKNYEWQLPTRPSLEPLDEVAVMKWYRDWRPSNPTDSMARMIIELCTKFGKPRELDYKKMCGWFPAFEYLHKEGKTMGEQFLELYNSGKLWKGGE